jgi:hypothetical protein
MPVRESSIEAALVKFAKANGVLTYKFVSPSHRGVPDRLFVGNGTTLYLELKRPGEKPTPIQDREIKRLAEKMVPAFCVDNVEAGKALISDYCISRE